MSISSRLDRLHFRARENRWLQYFAILLRVGLAAGFLPSGFTKIMGERFTVLSNMHPMGNYLEALFHTGFYYTSIGVLQVIAGILLLIPRTATLGAIIYFPIITNICILSLAVRFEGSFFTSPLMVLANVYLLCWDYHKFRLLLPFHHQRASQLLPTTTSNKFPFLFFTGVLVTMVALVLLTTSRFIIQPRNTLKDCSAQFEGTNRTEAGSAFCNCIHKSGRPLNSCLKAYHNTPDDEASKPMNKEN